MHSLVDSEPLSRNWHSRLGAVKFDPKKLNRHREKWLLFLLVYVNMFQLRIIIVMILVMSGSSSTRTGKFFCILITTWTTPSRQLFAESFSISWRLLGRHAVVASSRIGSLGMVTQHIDTQAGMAHPIFLSRPPAAESQTALKRVYNWQVLTQIQHRLLTKHLTVNWSISICHGTVCNPTIQK